MNDETRTIWTTAPAEYDYGYAEPQGEVGEAVNGKPVREVVVPVDRLEYQLGRYRSGLFMATDRPENARRSMRHPDEAGGGLAR